MKSFWDGHQYGGAEQPLVQWRSEESSNRRLGVTDWGGKAKTQAQRNTQVEVRQKQGLLLGKVTMGKIKGKTDTKSYWWKARIFEG